MPSRDFCREGKLVAALSRRKPLGKAVVAMPDPRKFRSYEEFFSFYLEHHRKPGNRWMHAIGTTLGLIVAIVAFATHHPWYALLWIPLGYSFAWTGHFLVEKNTPGTFGHPFWSFISDFRMLGLMVTGRLNSRMKVNSSPPRTL